MFEYKECISITWDKDYNVFGLNIKKDKKNRQVVDFFSCSTEEKSFAERLKAVYDKLYINQDQFIILGGYIPSTVCFELNIPPLAKKEIEQYLHYELSRQIPYPVNELKWNYRVISPKKDTAEKKIKIFAVLEKNWNELIEDIVSSGIKIDNYIYPFFAITPLFSESSIDISDIENDFYFVSSSEFEDCYMKSININTPHNHDSTITNFFSKNYIDFDMENSKPFIPGLIIAEYFFSKGYTNDKSGSNKLINGLQPKRFKNLKIIALFLFIVLLIFSGSYLVRKRMNVMDILDSLEEEKVLLSNAIKKLHYKYVKVKEYDSAIKEIEEATPGAVNPIEYLEYLTKAIPGNIWMTSFASNKDKVNITLQTNSDAGNITAALNRSKLFKTENVRKRKTSTGSQYIYLTLQSRQTENQ